VNIRRIIDMAKPWHGRLALVAALMVAESLLLLGMPLVAGMMAGGIIEGAGPSLPLLAALLLGLLAGVAGLRILSGIISGTTALLILADLRGMIHDHLQSLPLPFHEDHKQGDLLALTTWEIGRLSDFLTGTLVSLVPLLLTAGGAVILMFGIDPTLALIVPLLIPAFYLALKIVGRRLRRIAVAWQEAEAETIAIAEEHLEMTPAIKSFTREAVASARYAAALARSRDIGLREMRIHAVVSPLTQYVAAAAAVVLLLLAGQVLRAGAMSTAELVSFLLYAGLLTRPVAALADVYGKLQSLRGTLARLETIIEMSPEPLHQGQALTRTRGELRFEGVCFTYPGRAGTLNRIDLAIPAGQTIALTGPNGAGKSTLISLLLRYRKPDAGRILLDGCDIATLRLSDLRRQIGLVPQRPLLFNGTIAENIGFGREMATEAQIIAAARLAQAHGFITDLPRGYDTMIGDHGVRLSGGQGQRIALARALIKDPPILVLDEATSMFDPEGETDFIAAAAAALRDRTVILITHRPASLALAERIVQLTAGHIMADERTAA
jgi:ABC-type multidrug transport system fused ATPase/permease subunit